MGYIGAQGTLARIVCEPLPAELDTLVEAPLPGRPATPEAAPAGTALAAPAGTALAVPAGTAVPA